MFECRRLQTELIREDGTVDVPAHALVAGTSGVDAYHRALPEQRRHNAAITAESPPPSRPIPPCRPAPGRRAGDAGGTAGAPPRRRGPGTSAEIGRAARRGRG